MTVNQEIHLLYVDLRKAYDSIPQNKLWQALEKTKYKYEFNKSDETNVRGCQSNSKDWKYSIEGILT